MSWDIFNRLRTAQDQETVPYEEARALIRTGDIVFLGGAKSLFSWLITAVTRSVFSHCGIACWLSDEDGAVPTLFILEASAGGRRLVSMSHYGLRRPMTVIASPLGWENYREDLINGTGRVPYGYLDLIGIGLKETFKLKTKDFDGEVCSEMVAATLNRHGYSLDELQSPGTLYKSLLKKGCSIRVLTTPK